MHTSQSSRAFAITAALILGIVTLVVPMGCTQSPPRHRKVSTTPSGKATKDKPAVASESKAPDKAKAADEPKASSLREAPDEPKAPAASNPQGSPWGFCSSAEWFGDYPRFNPLMAKAGVRLLRAFPEWAGMQPRRGEWNWKGADDMLADAKSNSIRITGGFWYFAPWATQKGDTRSLPLKDPASWSEYVAGVVERYKDDIREWEVYNEFNGSFANSSNKPKDYAELVAAAWEAAQKVDPEIRIGMSCANFDLGFFDGAIKAGAAGKFDFIAVHPYENLGTLANGGEDGYLSMASNIRKMLADNEQPSDMGLWITEFGIQSRTTPDAKQDALQADILVKGYLLALAQGFERVFWFEARGPSYGSSSDHGVIRHDWSLRPCYHSLKAMTTILGDAPTYLGWLDLAKGGFGFMFEGATAPVLVAWAPKDSERTVSFTTDVKVMEVAGTARSIRAGQSLTLNTSPVYVAGVPADMLSQAKANASKPFPWGGDYSTMTEASCRLGATNIEKGIVQTNLGTTEVVHKLDHSYRTSHRKNSEGMYAYFRVNPRFVSFGSKELEITVVARRADPSKGVAFDICYESLSGYKETGRWQQVPAGEKWNEYSWKVTDANFVGGWGWNFRTTIGGSAGALAIREVRVTKTAARK